MRTTRGAQQLSPPVHDDAADPIPADDFDFDTAPRERPARDDAAAELTLCLACGAPPDEPSDDCAHTEAGTFRAPPRAVKSAITRLQRALDELHTARRALVALVPAECAQGRAEVTTRPPPRAAVATVVDPAAPCVVCTAREKSVRRKTLRPFDQQAFAFVR